MKIVFATHNPNKLKEVQQLLPSSITLVSLSDIGCTEPIEETASTIEGNALLKANYVADTYQLSCFADDTGLEVDALDGAPGVYSARYAGPEATAQSNITKLMHALDGQTHRAAQFKTSIALRLNDKTYSFEGICKGSIGHQLKGTGGFGYDPVFTPEGYDETFAEMSAEQKNNISHRGIAIQKLVNFLQHYTS